jgi:hypothetical protein
MLRCDYKNRILRDKEGNLISCFKLMTLSDSYQVIPNERPPFTFPFMVNVELDDKIQFIYDNFLYPVKRLKVGRAVKLNKTILLVQEIKKLTKKTPSKPKTYYTPLPESEIISDEEFMNRYRHYLDVAQIEHDPVYMNNRRGTLESVSKMMEGIPIIDDTTSCGKTTDTFQRMTHQEIIRRYINSYTPYRGLLLFHGLGSGKTCSSISLIEGLMDTKKVIIMTPASLQSNYRTQMKFCGDHLFRKQNHWVFERFKKDGEGITSDFRQKRQSAIDLLQLNKTPLLDKFMEEISGLWMVQKSGKPNFDTLHIKEKEEIDRQLTILIKEKYTYINYNGLTQKTWKTKYKQKANVNPFDNSTIIIDEAHNFVSRIVNKLKKKKLSISVELYEEMMSAENCRIILLTGTPFINYPYELGVLFNLIHGYTYVLEIKIQPKKSTTEKYFEDLFSSEGIADIVEYKEQTKILTITKNPYGFIKQSDGKVVYTKDKQIYYSEFVDKVMDLLKTKTDMFTIGEVNNTKVKHLPDTQAEFDKYFLSSKVSQGTELDSKLKLFQRRIIGMVSYLGDKTNLMPKIVESTDHKRIHLESVVMSTHQVSRYAETRKIERKQETSKKSKKKKEPELEESSSYRIFSRAACNFAFPPDMERPMPGKSSELGESKLVDVEEIDEGILDDVSEHEMITDIDGKYDTSDVEILRKNKEQLLRYKNEIDGVLIKFEKTPEDFFETGLPKLVKINHPEKSNRMDTYSPKFKRILENILLQPDEQVTDENGKEMTMRQPGCHLIYSNFRKLEGIGLFRLALLYHGYKELKIENNRIKIYSMFKPRVYMDDKKEHRYFALFTGTETVEEKEILLNIYNNRFKNLPKVTQDDLNEHFGHLDLTKNGNIYGEIIKILMITASGAEGIDLKNTRFVHIMEPYWHHVRINQVIGRARRICSHMDLPTELKDVTVYMYISIFGDDVLKTDQYSELKNMDNAESTDMRLQHIMEEKERLSERYLDVLKRTSIDCALNYRNQCFRFSSTNPTPKKLITPTLRYQDAPSQSKPI